MNVNAERKQLSVNPEHKNTSMLRDCRINTTHVSQQNQEEQPEEENKRASQNQMNKDVQGHNKRKVWGLQLNENVK